ncbi:uncharacterized protein LOC136042055 [Artemia franciscana]|uniref:uncharacterized protein LOC136042055 n=1 Tax=Artemia franciscana TaxID=6661 RepID=UPI0032D9EDDF
MKLFLLIALFVVGYVTTQEVDDAEYAKESRLGHQRIPYGYFQYANNPGPYQYEFGYSRGNPHHSRSHYEQASGPRFRARVKWNDAYSGYGEHYMEYNHAGYHLPVHSGAALGGAY